MTHTATTLAYVRTNAGVVTVAAGDPLPTVTQPGEVERLLAAGTITAAAEPERRKSRKRDSED